MTGENATIDVFLLDKKFMNTLPNRVRVANKILDFKSGYKNHIDSSQNVVWENMNHFKLEVKPKTTIDFTDIAGDFLNGSPFFDAVITVNKFGKVDTLLNGRRGFRENLFQFKSRGLGRPVIFYDIK
jgi:hypothetical protein